MKNSELLGKIQKKYEVWLQLIPNTDFFNLFVKSENRIEFIRHGNKSELETRLNEIKKVFNGEIK